MEDLDEIVHEFLVESHENLDQLDSDLVALEGAPESRELLGSVFRTIHTIKGTSGFLAFNVLERLTHVGENLLVQLRDGKRVMDQPTTDVLLEMVDGVRALLRHIESDGTEGDVDVAPTVARIQAVLDGATAPAAPEAAEPEPATPEPVEPEPEPVDEGTVARTTVEPDEPAPTPDDAGTAEADLPQQRRPEPAPPRRKTVKKTPPPAVQQPSEPPPAASESAPHPVDPGEAPAEATRGAADGSIRVDVDLLDALMRQVGELVLARNAITRLADNVADVDLARASQRLSLIASELQEGVMKTRMQPIEHVWSKVPRMVRDVAAACSRQVRLEMTGGDTELDRSLLEAIKDPLTHLIRNAVDHGIEPPEDRTAAGKPAKGLVSLRAYHAGGQVVVEVIDDGKGIDSDRVAAKAVEKGLRTAQQVASMGQAELLQLLFLPGFSTAEAVTNVSGRGVGMDVVRTKIEAIGGTVDIESIMGRGTTWRLRIPLTLAIMPALTIECDEQLYAIPQVSLLELVALDAQTNDGSVEWVRGAPVYRLRGELLPLVDLREVFSGPAREGDGRTVIAVLQADTQRFGLMVDRVLNTEEIVVKPLSARLKSIGLYAGATLLGDGRVSLILDVQAIARRCMNGELGEADRHDQDAQSDVERDIEQVLITAIGEDRRIAIPLSAVTRLEKLPAASVERVANREVVQYRGAITPVVRLSNLLGGSASTGEELTVVVYTRRDRSVAIVVEEIIDIVDDDTAHHSDLGDRGLLGSTVLKDRVTELLDVHAAVTAGDPYFFDDEPADEATEAQGEVPAQNGAHRSGELVGV
ncbi:chemotaxis protein CheW [Cellulomonas bogoriensis]|uniref:histidine kinase n=1 Tax=Cellulomonas bogoriensis 69B4 = DSM 16987 TaxID=1386082 RepID=A0A0A0BTS9_9CELL|nr:chemotaxis protein CheW [Cellulomonas bogoriensis]KGM11360.1 chemotaxis protein CheA [Cellulomonas bogoriensis 69B4 = DSM 16987]